MTFCSVSYYYVGSFLNSGIKDASYPAQVTKPGGANKHTHQDVHMQFRSSTSRNFSVPNPVEEHVRPFLMLIMSWFICFDLLFISFGVHKCIYRVYPSTCCAWCDIIFVFVKAYKKKNLCFCQSFVAYCHHRSFAIIWSYCEFESKFLDINCCRQWEMCQCHLLQLLCREPSKVNLPHLRGQYKLFTWVVDLGMELVLRAAGWHH